MAEPQDAAAANESGTSMSFVGAEWWVQHRPPMASQSFHFDFDQALYHRGGGLQYPTWSSVLYLSEVGGPTVVIEQRAEPQQHGWWSSFWHRGRSHIEQSDSTPALLQLVPQEADEADVLYPTLGMYALFHGDRLHGVLPPMQGEEAQGMRTTLLVNWWMKEPEPPSCSPVEPELLHAMQAASTALQDDEVLSVCESPLAQHQELHEVMLGAGGCQQLKLDISLPEGPRAPCRPTEVALLLPLELKAEAHAKGAIRVTGMDTVRFFRAMYD